MRSFVRTSLSGFTVFFGKLRVEGRLQRLAVLASVLLLFGLAGNAWVHTVREIVRDYSALPKEDYWRVPENLHQYRALDLKGFWRQHNEHRIIFPEIVFAADMLFVHGRQLLPLAVSFVAYLATWFLMAWTLLRHGGVRLLTGTIAISLAAFLAGWPGSSGVLAWAFLLQWTLVQLAALSALFLLARAAETSNNFYLAGAIGSALIATFSSGNGLVLWPVLLIAGVLSLDAKRMVLLFASAIVSIATFFYRYHFLGNTSAAKPAHHPLYFLGFIESYVSMPFGAIKGGPRLGLYIGTVYFAILFFLVVRAVQTRRFHSTPFLTFCGFCVFNTLSATLTALGRIDPADRNFHAAKVPRYVTLPILGWAALILLLLWLSDQLSWKTFSPVRISMLLTLLLVFAFPKLRPWIRSIESDWAEVQWTALSVESGLTDPGMIRKVFPDPAFVESLLPEMRRDHLSVFDYDYAALIGQSAAGRFTLERDRSEQGEVTYIWPILSGLEIAGWTNNGNRNERIVITDENGRIVGFGRRLPAGFPRDLPASQLLATSGWVGFANLRFGSNSFTAYDVGSKGTTLIPIGMPFTAPPIQAATAADAGPALDHLKWRMDSSWAKDAIPPRVDVGVPPSGQFFGSWTRSDAKTGQILSEDFDVPAKSCLVLPVLHGPSVKGLSAEVVDSATGDSVAYAPLQDADTGWRFWRIRIKPGVRRVRIAANDSGSGWGQWLAVGQPALCK